MAIIGEQELTAANQTIYKRGKLLINYMTQPFFVTETQTGKKGVYVTREDTVRDVQMIIEGKLDTTPVESLLYIGTLRDAGLIEEKNDVQQSE